MAFWDFFTSRHVRWLEAEIEDLRRRHATDIADLKKTHAEELDRAITEASRLRGEVDRFRLYLAPALQPIGQPIGTTEPEPTKGKEPVFGGTPFQRILQREMAKQEKEANARYTKPVEPTKENNDGSQREGRIETPLSEPSKTA